MSNERVCYRSDDASNYITRKTACVRSNFLREENNILGVAPTRWPLTIEKYDETESRERNHSDRRFEISRDDENQLSSFDPTGARACRVKLSHLC